MALNGNVTINKHVLIYNFFKPQIMKKYFLLVTIIPLYFSSQVILGVGRTKLTNQSVSLEFGTEGKGIVLPWVTSESAVLNAVPGTLIFDTADRKVKLKHLSSWQDLSVDATGAVNTTLQDSYLEKADAKVSIGQPTNTPGILVLEDTNKGMILPLVSSYRDVKQPAAGMVVFDVNSKYLCVFNGTVWSFWGS